MDLLGDGEVIRAAPGLVLVVQDMLVLSRRIIIEEWPWSPAVLLCDG